LCLVGPARAAGPGALPENVFAAGPVAAALKLPDDVFARPPGDDRVDVVLIGGARAAVVRVRVKVGERGFRSTWGEFLVRLYAYLDKNNDGVLTVAEANRAPWTNLLQSPFHGNRPVGDRYRQNNGPGPKPSPETSPIVVLLNDDARLAVATRLVKTFGKAGKSGRPSIDRPGPLGMTAPAFRAADRDGDGTLDAREV